MGCFITIIGAILGIVGLAYLLLAHSFSDKGEMIWGIVIMVIGVVLFFGGIMFKILFADKE